MNLKSILEKIHISGWLIKVIYCILVFVLSVIVLSGFMNRGNTDMTAPMAEATYPVVAFSCHGMEYNRMHGYADEMNIQLMQDHITPVGSDRTLTLTVDSCDNKITGISFAVRNLSDGRLIEDSKVLDYIEKKGEITADLILKDLLSEGCEYSLCITLTDERNRQLHYYTTIIRSNELSLTEKLEFVEEFHELTYKRNEAEEKIVKYIESDETGDNTTYQKVTIHSSLDQICWGTLQVTEDTMPTAVIRNIDKDTADIDLEYKVSVDENDKTYEFFINEYFRLRLGTERIYLLDYEREMEQIFKPDTNVIAGNKIVLGIADRDVNMVENNDGSNIAFVSAGRLFTYDLNDRELAYVFGFYDSDTLDKRETDRNNGIRISNVDETGNVRFIVYGYMNRGIHEGTNGIAVYYYDSTLNTVEEEAFIPYKGAFSYLKYNIDKQVYAGSGGMAYSFLDGDFMSVALGSGETEIIAGGLSDREFCASEDGSMAAWVDPGCSYTADELHILNMVTGKLTDIKTGSEERIRPVGFFGNDVIYGLAKTDDIFVNRAGETVFPMYCLRIRGEDGSIKKEYYSEGEYVTDIVQGRGMYTLNRAAISVSGNGFTELPDDRLMDNSTPVYGLNVVEPALTDSYETITQIALKNETDPDSIQILNPKQVIFEGEKNSEASESEIAERFPLFRNGKIVRMFDSLPDAIKESYENNGSVRNRYGYLIYMRSAYPTKNQIMKITPDDEGIPYSGNSAASCISKIQSYEGRRGEIGNSEDGSVKEFRRIFETALPGYELLDLSGSSDDVILYYVSRDIPVVTVMDNTYMLITGYNEIDFVLYDPRTGTVSKKGRDECTEKTEAEGRILLTYLPPES